MQYRRLANDTEHHPSYLRVFLTFARNSLIRDMTFRSNFVIETIASMSWMFMNLGFYILIFSYVDSIGADTGWGKYQFFIIIATTMLINSLVQAFFMPNAEEFSELIRTGNLDFALLKPIDTQFLVSLHKVHWSGLGNTVFALCLLGFSLYQLYEQQVLRLTLVQVLLYPLYVVCGVLVLYSLMISLASSSIWLGRNQSLYNFWFYITNFSRYPMEIFDGPPGNARQWVGRSLRGFFSFVVPVLLAVNIPARMMAKPFDQNNWPLAAFALLATVASLWLSRRIFYWALKSYRSASS